MTKEHNVSRLVSTVMMGLLAMTALIMAITQSASPFAG